MPIDTAKLLFAVATGLLLAACAQIAPQSPAVVAAAEADDDAYCRSNAGPPGSNAYAACLKDRDAVRSAAQNRMDRTHQRMVDDMLNRR
jgi:hypothetical protein